MSAGGHPGAMRRVLECGGREAGLCGGVSGAGEGACRVAIRVEGGMELPSRGRRVADRRDPACFWTAIGRALRGAILRGVEAWGKQREAGIWSRQICRVVGADHFGTSGHTKAARRAILHGGCTAIPRRNMTGCHRMARSPFAFSSALAEAVRQDCPDRDSCPMRAASTVGTRMHPGCFAPMRGHVTPPVNDHQQTGLFEIHQLAL